MILAWGTPVSSPAVSVSLWEKSALPHSSVTGIGRKKAERLVLELQDRFADLVVAAPAPRSSGTDEAVRALTALGYAPLAADDAVRAALAAGAPEEPAQLIRRALQLLTRR